MCGFMDTTYVTLTVAGLPPINCWHELSVHALMVTVSA